MQIPYDLEFVENRPTVRAIAMSEPSAPWRVARPGREQDAFDVLLRWVHRMLRRLEER